MAFNAYAETERGEKRRQLESKRSCIKGLAAFRMVIALITMLLGGALGIIIERQTSQNELIAELRGKWKTISWIYSGASQLMLFVAFRLVIFLIKAKPSTVLQRQNSGVRCLLTFGLLMAIFEGYIAVAAFVDSGNFRPVETSVHQANEPDTSESNDRVWVLLMTLSCTAIVLLTLEVLILVLIYYQHRSMRPNNYSEVNEFTTPGKSFVETEQFIPKPSGVNGSVEVLHYTNEFTIDKIASGKCDKGSSKDEIESTRPVFSPPNLVINEIYEAPERPKLPRKLKDVPPPLPPANSTSVKAATISPQDAKHCTVKPSRMQTSPPPPPSPSVGVSLPHDATVDTTPPESGTSDEARKLQGPEQGPSTAGGEGTINRHDLSRSEPTAPANNESSSSQWPLQRTSSFKRYERSLSLTRRSIPGSNSHFPPYEDTKFAYYDPEKGTFARPINNGNNDVF